MSYSVRWMLTKSFLTFLIFIPFVEGQQKGDLRLRDGITDRQGRLEIFDGINTWGTVCDDEFDNIDAVVACRQLGFSSGKSLGNVVKDGSGNIFLDNMACSGRESKLIYCSRNSWGTHDCGHSEDVGVACYMFGELRIKDGSTTSGRLEIFNGIASWGTICDDEFDDTDATIACRQLGYSSGEALFNRYVSDGSGSIHLDDLQCKGIESSLYMCQHNGWNKHNCQHSEDVGVRCSFFGELRLQGGSTTHGRLEIRDKNGDWGTICDDDFDDRDAVVACRQLGFTGGRTLNNTVPDGKQSIKIFLDDLRCNGSEISLLLCSSRVWGSHNCDHGEDVGVQCYSTGLFQYKSAIDGGWGNWLSWSSCTASCGSGRRYRSRNCDNPIPNFGGDYCNGLSLSSSTCNYQRCPVNGHWGHWVDWSLCSKTCGSGTRTRSRLCNRPNPSHYGNNCTGTDSDSEICSDQQCPVNGQWGLWMDWSPCSQTCGNGTKRRVRFCTNPTPQYGGNNCTGQNVGDETCHFKFCAETVEGDNNVGIMAGIAVGSSAFTALCAVIFFFILAKCKNPEKKNNKSRDRTYEDTRMTQNDVYVSGASRRLPQYQVGSGKKSENSFTKDNAYIYENMEETAFDNMGYSQSENVVMSKHIEQTGMNKNESDYINLKLT